MFFPFWFRYDRGTDVMRTRNHDSFLDVSTIRRHDDSHDDEKGTTTTKAKKKKNQKKFRASSMSISNPSRYVNFGLLPCILELDSKEDSFFPFCRRLSLRSPGEWLGMAFRYRAVWGARARDELNHHERTKRETVVCNLVHGRHRHDIDEHTEAFLFTPVFSSSFFFFIYYRISWHPPAAEGFE